MQLASAIKVTYNGSHRVISPEQTYRRIRSLMEKIGVTDILDMTDHYGVAIPIWSAWRRQGDNSSHIVSYGKGTNSVQSQVSAMMEALERYAAEQLPRTIKLSSYCAMKQKFNALDPRTAARGANNAFSEHVELAWLPGTDLFTGEEQWAPASCVLLHPTLQGCQFVPMRTSNGLASGNILEEAICHSLCEMIERDAWTLAWLRAVTLPRIRTVARLILRHPGSGGWSNISAEADLFPDIDTISLPPAARQLIDRFERAGVTIIVRDITSDIAIPTFLAVSTEMTSDGNAFMCGGTGAHPHAPVAVIRAITECAQSRRVALRDFSPGQKPGGSVDAGLFRQQLFFARANHKKDFSSITTHHNRDVLDDINLMLSRLYSVGVQQAIAVDLTQPELGIPVVRILIPGIEDWSAFGFAPQRCVLGHRGQKYLEATPYAASICTLPV